MKTLWEKEKMLETSIFSFSHNVFDPSQTKIEFFFHINYRYLRLKVQSFVNTVCVYHLSQTFLRRS